VNQSQRACSDFRTKLPIQSSHTPKFPQDRKITGGKLGVSRPISSQYDILISEQKWLNMFWAKNAHIYECPHPSGCQVRVSRHGFKGLSAPRFITAPLVAAAWPSIIAIYQRFS
jgi:hypothetical protein